MGRILIALALALASGSGAAAQQLSLEGAVQTALENNPTVHAARARSEAAAARAGQARGHRLPTLDLSETFVHSDNPAEVFALTLNQRRFDFEEFFNSDPNRPDPLSTWITSLELGLPIYTGGRLSARVSQAASMAAAAEADWRHTRQRVAFDAITAFINLARAREQVGLMTKSRDTTAEHLRLAEAYAEQGLILDAEVLRAKVFLAEMEELLAQAANGSRLAQSALNFHLGIDHRMPRSLAPLLPPPPVAGDVDDWRAAGIDRRRDLAAARLRLEAGREEDQAARSGYLPEIAAVGSYDLFDDTVFGSHGRSGSIAAVARINLYRGGSDSAKRSAARHEIASGEHEVRRFEEGIGLEVEQAWQDLVTAHARLRTATDSLAAAREALRVREHRFGQGLDRMIDLLDAETALREAELRELSARFDVALGSYRLIFVSGGSLTQSAESPEATP